MDNNLKILIVEDDAIDARFIQNVLNASGYEPDVVQHPNDALTALGQHPYDLVLVDLKMADMSGMEILELIKRYYPATEVIIITAHASIDTAVEAIRLGAYSYFVKGEPARKLVAEVKTIANRQKQSNSDGSADLSSESSRLKTRGNTFIHVLSQAEKAASAGMNVLLVGAPGTGRKALAQHMGQKTPYKDGHVFEIDFSAKNGELTRESATHGLNKFLDQHGGTGTCLLFNVDQADPLILSELLTSLEGHLSRYSSGKAAFSVISTSTLQSISSLKIIYGSGLFFLYWGIKIELPEIMNRREDLPLIVDNFIKIMSTSRNMAIPSIDSSLYEYLANSVFVREFEGLETLLRRILEIYTGETLTADLIKKVETDDLLLPREQLIFPSEPSSLKEAREQTEREFIKTVYDRSGCNKSKTAIALGISPRQLYNMLNKYNFEE